MPTASPRTAREIRLFLVDLLAERLSVDSASIDVAVPFANFGLSSVDTVVVSGRLSDWLGRSLPPTLLWKHPTVASLAEALAGSGADTDDRPEQTVAEPAAIVGIGCRYAGTRGPAEFWRLLFEGRDTVTPAPEERLRWPYADRPAPRDGQATWHGSFLDDPYAFDPGFFGISADEAARMDPQQRILLETTVDALDDAGVPMERIAGTETGVFVGVPPSDYGRPRMSYPDPTIALGTGNATSMVASRVSYVFDLHGPCLNIDTACSSSLVALHTAMRSMAVGECTQALVAGVNITLDPFSTDCLADANLMAADGRCKTFDERADGYVRGEGCVVVLLKPLSAAQADNDRIYGLVLGTAVNQDGRTNGLTAPNQQAQQTVVRRAYRAAGVAPGEVQYVELHGTGTALGDPIEARALGAVVGADRLPGDRCLVGSVKTNVGHTETAAGLTGVVKTALAVHHGQIPPSLHFRKANPLIPLDELGLAVVTEPTPWPEVTGPRLAGVSSFGWGGTNCHAVLSSPPEPAGRRPKPSNPAGPHVVALSAQSEASAARAVSDLLAVVSEPGAEVSLPDLAYTSTARRSGHRYRVAVAAGDRTELAERLAALAAGTVPAGAVVGRRPLSGAGRLAFAFTGQGSQWWQMGRRLIRREPVFRDALLACDRPLRRALGWSPFALLDRGRDETLLADTGRAQPVIFAVQVALAELWKSYGIVPDCVLGHSMGEVAAAHVAGILDLPTAAQLIAARATAMATPAAEGRMAVVRMPAAELADRLAGAADVVVAGRNSPTWTLVSGSPARVDELLAALGAEGVAARVLDGRYAFHGPWLAGCLPDFQHRMPELAPASTGIAFYSTVVGGRVTGPRLDADYWAGQVVAPVAFAEAVDAAVADGCVAVVEVGPHPALSGMLREIFRARGVTGVAVGSMRRDEDEVLVLRTAAATLWAHGYDVDWAAVAGAGRRLTALPPYPFEHASYRVEPPRPDHGPARAIPGVAGPAVAEPAATDPAVAESAAVHSAGDPRGPGAARPEEAQPGLFAPSVGHVPPRTAAERFVAAEWSLLLGVDHVGATDNFAALGGSSLVAIQFVDRVLERAGVELSLDGLMDRPTVARVAEALEQELAAADLPLPLPEPEPEPRRNDR